MAGLGGVIGTVLGYLGYQIGQRTDAASATGSLHAKVAELRNYIPSDVAKPRGARISGSFSLANAASYTTALSISGKGKLNALAVALTSTQYDQTAKIKITVDGHVIVLGGTVHDHNIVVYPLPNFLFSNSSDETLIMDTTGNNFNLCGGISFKSSIKIEMLMLMNSSGATLSWQYELE